MNLHPTVRLIFRIKHGSVLFSVWHENILPSSSQVTLKLSVVFLGFSGLLWESDAEGPSIFRPEVQELNVEHVSVTLPFSVTFFGSSKVSRHGFSANVKVETTGV